MAAAEAANEATASGFVPDLVIAFVAADHHDAAEDVAALLEERFPGAAIVGCCAQGIIGGTKELEAGPAVSIVAASLPDTRVIPFHLQGVETPDEEFVYSGWPDALPDEAGVMILADPFSFPTDHFLRTVNAQRPGLRFAGGVASGAAAQGEARLILGGRVLTEGAIAVAVDGRVRLEAVVSQGCRPIGEPATITRADRNIIFELAGERPIDRIAKIWKHADPLDREMMKRGPIFIGKVVNEYKADFERGDFVVRTVMGGNAETGILAVNDIVEVGETIQFHVLDPATAEEDLRVTLDAVGARPAGALLFACNGRGTNMFEKPDHDASILGSGLGYIPTAGFFCQGEVGPVGGRNFLHTFTAAMALFVDTSA